MESPKIGVKRETWAQSLPRSGKGEAVGVNGQVEEGFCNMFLCFVVEAQTYNTVRQIGGIN